MLLMAGIRERDKRAVAGFWIRRRIGISYHVCSMFAICSFCRRVALARFDPQWPTRTLVARFALARFKLVAIEDVQHAGEGGVVGLHDIPNGPRSVGKNRHDETRIFVT